MPDAARSAGRPPADPSDGKRVPRSTRSWLVDLALGAACAYAAGLLATEITRGLAADGRARVVLVVAVVHGASVVLRRWSPAAMVAVLLLTACAYAVLGFPVALLGPAVLVAMYSVATILDRRPAVATLVGVEAAVLVLTLLGPGPGDLDSTALFAVLVAGAWFLGHITVRWRTLAEENGRRAAELEQARTELAAQAVALERARIAHELHDVVAHSMSVIAMHAGAGRLAVGTDPAAAASAMAVIERTSREALGEMRRLVSVLRDDSTVEDPAPLAPAPGLGDLSTLVAATTSAGLVVDVTQHVDTAQIPPGVSLAAYRVVQEALTNVVRHVGPVRVTVGVRIADAEVDVSVENAPGTRPAPVAADTGGHGLRGMRERVQLYGGTLVAGPTASGGWRVGAHFPRQVP